MWVDLEGIILNGVRKRKVNASDFTYKWYLKNNINELKKWKKFIRYDIDERNVRFNGIDERDVKDVDKKVEEIKKYELVKTK